MSQGGWVVPDGHIIGIVDRLKNRVTSNTQRFSLGVKIIICLSPRLIICNAVPNEYPRHIAPPFRYFAQRHACLLRARETVESVAPYPRYRYQPLSITHPRLPTG